MTDPVRVLIVDDSAFMRHTITKYLQTDSGIAVVGAAHDGLDALAKIPALKPDVVTLDVEMPRMDGLTALKRIMAECPTPVVMVSALTQQGATATIRALMRGAVDFVPKPSAGRDIRTIIEEVTRKVKTAAGVRPLAPTVPEKAPSAPAAKLQPRPFHKGDPVVIIGASTGGPRALQQVLSDLPPDLPAAVAVVQHMPQGFTHSLAQRLDECSPLAVREAADGDRLTRRVVLLAPGDFHLRLNRRRVILDQGPPRHHVRPAADVTMESAAESHGSAVIGVVLTGMGSDGTEGATLVKEAGGKVIAEHESTSVVYGMPRSVVEAGLADQVVPLPDVAPMLMEMLK
jgi:two-component system chemotaxis response regulator CheB